MFGLSAAMKAGGSFDEFMSTMERETTPGTLCKYNSADTQALGMLLAGATGRSITDFMQEKLCEPLGMESSSYWMDDSRGSEMVAGGLLMTARDFAKLGELYRNGGVWGGQQIVPAAYVAASIKPDAPHLAPGKPIVPDHPLPLGSGSPRRIPKVYRGEFTRTGAY